MRQRRTDGTSSAAPPRRGQHLVLCAAGLAFTIVVRATTALAQPVVARPVDAGPAPLEPAPQTAAQYLLALYGALYGTTYGPALTTPAAPATSEDGTSPGSPWHGQAEDELARRAAEYLSNGSQALAVPSSGPAAAYFQNGAEALAVPTSSWTEMNPTQGAGSFEDLDGGSASTPPAEAGAATEAAAVETPGATATAPAMAPAHVNATAMAHTNTTTTPSRGAVWVVPVVGGIAVGLLVTWLLARGRTPR